MLAAHEFLNKSGVIQARPGGMNPEVGVPMTTQKVVIVNGNTQVLGLLDGALVAGHYDVVFVEPGEHAYSQIKRVQPNLVILFTRLEDAQGYQVLSMLKLDVETRTIPVLTYTTEYEGQEGDDDGDEHTGTALFAPQLAGRMN